MDERIKKAYDIIQEEFKNNLSLDELSFRVGISKFHLQRLFKSEFNESPAQCIQRIRIQRALHFLKLKTNLSLQSIALECGFSSPAVFSRAFQKFYGKTPSEILREPDNIPMEKSEEQFVEIVHLPEIQLVCILTDFIHPELSNEFEQVKAKCNKLNLSFTGRKFGIINHSAIIHPDGKLNYQAGMEISGKIPSRQLENLFTIPPGKFASFTTNKAPHFLVDELITLKYSWLDHSKYTIKDLLILEQFIEDPEIKNPLRRVLLPVIERENQM